MSDLQAAASAARTHAKNLADDIRNATTRIEHIRLSRLATEAEALADMIEKIAA
jgi:hypothetical protein